MAGLHPVDAGVSFPVYCSARADDVAGPVARRCQRAATELSTILGFEPQFTLLVLEPADWGDHSWTPIYSMPHVTKREGGSLGAPAINLPNTLVVGSRRGAFFDTVVDRVVDALGDDARDTLRAEYPGADGTIDVARFSNMLVIHELGHLFEYQVPFEFPRRWLSEFFANLCLHAVIAHVEPEAMPTLLTLPTVALSATSLEWKYRSLADFDRKYIRVGAENYAWYQFNLHQHAARVYDAGGSDAVRKFHTVFRDRDLRGASDAELADFLRSNIGDEAAAIISGWPT